MRDLARVGGDSWDAATSQVVPRPSTMKLLDSKRTDLRPSLTDRNSKGRSSSSRGLITGVDKKASAPASILVALPGPSSTPRDEGVSAKDRRTLSPKERRPLQQNASPTRGGVVVGTATSSSSWMPRNRSVGTFTSAESGGVKVAAPVPFQRVALAASRKQMAQALKFSHAATSTRDNFARQKTAATVQEHQFQHISRLNPSDGGELSDAQLLARGPAARAAYFDALKHGRVRPRTLKLMFVGQGRAGKTSTLKALVGQAFDSKEPSTHGLRTSLPLVRSDCAGLAGSALDLKSALVSGWRVLDQLEHELNDFELQRTCAQFIAERLRSGASMNNDQMCGAAVGTVSGPDVLLNPDEVDSIGRTTSPERAVAKLPVDLIAQIIEGHGQDSATEEITLKTWDFGGQREYYVMHHLFLTNRGVYLVITRLDAWLRDDDLEGPLDPNAQVEESFEPPLEALTFWLSSIHIHAPDALIVIVGTHADMVAESFREEAHSRVDREITDLMSRVPGVERQIVVNDSEGLCFFPVDNTGGAIDPGVSALRACLDRVVAESLAPGGPFGEPLPLSWVQMRDKLEDCAAGTTGDDGAMPVTATFVLPLETVRGMAAQVGLHDNIEQLECLKYMHAAGSIVFFDEDELRDNVVLNTQWLADAMAHVLNCPRVVQGSVAAVRRLRERGELEDDLLCKHLWKAQKFRQHHEVLLRMLYRFDLIIPTSPLGLGSHSGDIHIVPCLLPMAPSSLGDPGIPELDSSLYCDFHGLLCRLLPTIFPKLVAASARRPDINVISALGLYRDSFRLLWNDHELVMDLVPRGRPQVVRVRFVSRHTANGDHFGNRELGGKLSVAVVRALLDLIQATLALHNHLTFTAGVLCEHCHVHGGSRRERYHVIDVNELVAERHVICRLSSRVVSIPDGTWVQRWRNEIPIVSPLELLPALSPFVAARSESPAPTISTDLSIDTRTFVSSFADSRNHQPKLPTSSSLALNVRVPLVHFLYASPLWIEGDRGGELPPLDISQEAELLLESIAVVAGTASVNGTPDAATDCSSGRILWAQPATALTMQRLLTSGASSILHFSLHCGEGGQQLLLEDDCGGAHALALPDLVGLLAATHSTEHLGLVFLNSCCSELAGRAFVSAGAAHVVCCRGAVFDATARCFTRAFYMALYTGRKTVSQAFEIARAAIRTVPQVGLRAEAEKYLLLPLNADHSALLCDLVRRGHGDPSAMMRAAPSLSQSVTSLSTFTGCSVGLPHRVEDFCGRARDLWMLMKHLGSGRRCVVVCGEAEVGKSALLVELARFAGAPGRKFGGRTVYFEWSSECLDFMRHLLAEAAPDDTNSLPLEVLAFLQKLEAALLRCLEGQVMALHQCSREEAEAEAAMFSAAVNKRFLILRIASLLQRLEDTGSGLLVMDQLDPLLEESTVAEELQKILRELLLRTERVVMVLGSRLAILQSLNPHKVVAFRLEPLRGMDAARLFLWRVHRPLTWSDLSDAAGEVADGLPLIINAQNRSLVLSRLAEHPFLERCGGLPGLLRVAADRVLPGGGNLFHLSGA